MSLLPLSRLFHTGRADDHPVAMTADGTVLPFSRIRADVAALTARLRRAEYARVGLWCEDGYAFAVGLLAIAHAGAVAILPPNGQPGTLADLAENWDVLIGDGDVAGLEGGGAPPLGMLDTESCAIEFFTSGTTAAPKRVQRNLGLLEREALAIADLLGPLASGPVLATVPHQHAYGLAFRLLWPLSSGRPFAAHTDEVWETLLPRLQDAVLVSSPAHLGRLGGLTGTWRPALVLSAGAPLPPAAAAGAAALFGTAPLEIFGSTETGAIASRTWRTADAPWLPLPGIHVERDGDGRLSLLSPWIAGRHTGDDLVEMVDNGFVLRGRAGRVVKVEGKRVSLPAVEAALARLPLVADAAVTLLDGAREELAAAVVPNAEGRDLLARLGPFRFGRHLRAMLAERLESTARPRRWRFVDTIPTAAMGKRQDATIAAMFEELHHG